MREQCSYASFETNASDADFGELINKVVDVFRPRNFFVTLFATLHTAPSVHRFEERSRGRFRVPECNVSVNSSFPSEIQGCRRTAKVTTHSIIKFSLNARRKQMLYEFENNYMLAFSHYVAPSLTSSPSSSSLLNLQLAAAAPLPNGSNNGVMLSAHGNNTAKSSAAAASSSSSSATATVKSSSTGPGKKVKPQFLLPVVDSPDRSDNEDGGSPTPVSPPSD